MLRKQVMRLLAATMTAALVTAAPLSALAADNTPPTPPTGSENGGTPPSGDMNGGTPPSGDMNGGTPPSGDMNGGPGGGGANASSATYNAKQNISETKTENGASYETSTADEIGLLVTGGTVTENNLTVTKSGDSNGGDLCNFYGQNAAVLAKGGAVLNIGGGTIKSSAEGANGVFSYGGNGAMNEASGDGTTVNLTDVKITTTGNGSGGIMTAGGGVTNAANLTIDTSGTSSAAIRSDRGGGTVTVNKGTYTTNGTGSPAIYSTADITVNDASLVSNKSEGVVIEGKNTVTLKNTSLTANNTQKNGNATHFDGVFLYQSMSGDSATGTSKFTMTNGSITNQNGEVFHVTSTDGVITLNNVAITNKDSADVLLDVSNDGWGSNGNNATLNAANQTLTGNILVSSAASAKASAASTLTMKLEASSLKGAINQSVASADQGTVNLTLDADSIWELTGDSYVTSISGSGKVNYNGHTLYVGGKAYTADSPYSGLNATSEQADTSNGTTSAGTTTAAKSVKFKNTARTFKASALKKAKKAYSIIKETGGGKVTVKKYFGKSKNYITVSKAGKVTVKKGTPKGTYKVKVTVSASGNYKAATKTFTVTVK